MHRDHAHWTDHYVVEALQKNRKKNKKKKQKKISDNQFNTMQENPIDSIRKLKLSNPYKIILGHLNVNSFRNQFELVADVIQGTFDIFFYQKLKLTKVSLINSFV